MAGKLKIVKITKSQVFERLDIAWFPQWLVSLQKNSSSSNYLIINDVHTVSKYTLRSLSVFYISVAIVLRYETIGQSETKIKICFLDKWKPTERNTDKI